MTYISDAYRTITPLPPRSRADKYIAENLGSSRGSVFLASLKNAYLDSPSLKNIFNISNYHGDDPDMLYLKSIHESREENKKLTEEEFNLKYAESGLAYDPNFTTIICDEILEKRRKMAINDYIIANGKGDLLDSAGQLAGGLVGSNVAPFNLGINVATGFVPAGAVLKGAWWAANPVKTNMVKFAIGGGIGQAALEPFIHQERELEQREYDLQDSLINIAESSIFSAALPPLGHGIKKGFNIGRGKYLEWRNRYFASPEELNPAYSTGNAALDMQFKHLVDEQSLNTSPHSSEAIIESFELLNEGRKTLREKGGEKFPEFFEFEDKIASLENNLHKEFLTGGDITALPEKISSILADHKKQLESIYRKYQDNIEFRNITEELNNIDEKIASKLGQEQSKARGYDLDQTDLAIARNQLENDCHIDLEDPKNAKSMFDNDYVEHQAQDLRKQLSELEELVKHLPDYEKHKIDIEQALSQASIEGGELDLLPLRDKLMDLIKQEEAKKTILSRKNISEGFKELLSQVDMKSIVISRELGSGLMNDLIKKDLLGYFRNKKFEDAIAQELWNITHLKKIETRSKIAKDIAAIIHKWQQQGISRINNAGGNIEQLAGYITRQSHSSFKIHKDGFEAWREFITPLLDLDKCDADLDLYQIHKNLATGRHLYENNEYMPYYRHHVNIADKFAYARKLHFKSASAWLKYNNEYGTHSLAHSIAINLDKMGRNIGLLESMGSQPYEFLNKLKNEFAPILQEKASDKNKPAQKQLNFISRDTLDKILESIIGVTPDNPTLAANSQSIRNLITMANLGRVALSSIPDTGLFVAEQMHNGIPYIEAQANLIKAAANSFNTSQKKEYARLLAVGTENLMGLAYSKFHSHQHIGAKMAGAISSATNYYFKLNLMDWWDNSFKSALGFVLSNHLAHNTKSSYKKAPIELKNNLKRYNIDEKDWKILKSFIKKADDGREYIIPPEWRVENREINEVATKFRTYLKDRVDTGIPTPHALERYATTSWHKGGYSTWRNSKVLNAV
jgi:hypothetical protein